MPHHSGVFSHTRTGAERNAAFVGGSGLNGIYFPLIAQLEHFPKAGAAIGEATFTSGTVELAGRCDVTGDVGTFVEDEAASMAAFGQAAFTGLAVHGERVVVVAGDTFSGANQQSALEAGLDVALITRPAEVLSRGGAVALSALTLLVAVGQGRASGDGAVGIDTGPMKERASTVGVAGQVDAAEQLERECGTRRRGTTLEAGGLERLGGRLYGTFNFVFGDHGDQGRAGGHVAQIARPMVAFAGDLVVGLI